MKEIPDVEKARFLKERKENFELLIKKVDKDFEQYKDLEILARERNSMRAIQI